MVSPNQLCPQSEEETVSLCSQDNISSACGVIKHCFLFCTVASYLFHVVVTAIGFQRRLIMSDRSRSRSPQISWRYYCSKTVAADGQHSWWKTWFPATPQWIKNRLDADKMWSQASATTAPPSSEAQGSAVLSESPKKTEPHSVKAIIKIRARCQNYWP